MQAIRKISSLKPTTTKGFLDKLEVYKRPLVFTHSTFSKALSSEGRDSTPAKIFSVQNRRSANIQSDLPKSKSSDHNGQIVNNSIGKSGNYKPKQVLVLHIPPNAQIEKNINNIGTGTTPAKVALVSADSATEDGLTGDSNTVQVTTIKFDDIKSKKMMLVPIVIYENAHLATASSSDKENDDQTVSPPIQPSIVPQNSRREVENKKDVYFFQVPSDLAPNLEKVPISSVKLDLQMEVPNVEKIVEEYVNLMKGGKSSNNNIDKKYTKSKLCLSSDLNIDGSENKNIQDESMPNGIIPLNFKAEINGVVGLNMGHIDEQILQELRDVDLNNLITSVTGNIANMMIQKSYEHLEQRNYSTTAVDSPSNIFQTYKTQMKKASEVQNAKMSKDNSKNIKPENASGQSTNILKTTPTQNIASTESTKETIKNSSPKKSIRSVVTTETAPVIYSENCSGQGSANSAPKEPEICNLLTYTRSNGRSADHFNSSLISSSKNPENKEKDYGVKNTDSKAVTTGDRKTPDCDCTVLFKKDDFKANEQTSEVKKEEAHSAINCTMPTSSVSKGTGEGNKSNIDSNRNKENHYGSNNTDSKGINTRDSKVLVCIHKKEVPPRNLNGRLTDDRENELKNYAIECTMLTSTRAGKCGDNKGTTAKQIDCSAFKPGGKKCDEKSKSKLDCACVGKESKNDPCPKSNTPFAGFGKILPCSPFTTTKGKSCCELFKKKDDPKSKLDCSAICGKKPPSPCGKKDEKNSRPKIDCSALSGKKSNSPCGKKDEKNSRPKVDCSALSGKKSDSPCGKKDEKNSRPKVDCSTLSGKKSDSPCVKKDEKNSRPKVDCSALSGKKSNSPCGKKDEKKSRPKIDCSALSRNKPECGKGEKKSECSTDCSALCGKKPESPCGKKCDKKSESKIDCSTKGKKNDQKKSSSKIDCSASGGKKIESICGKKDEKNKESKTNCSAICGKKSEKKSETKINCSALCGKKNDNKLESIIQCSTRGMDDKRTGSKINFSSMCGTMDDKKSGSKIDCSAICGKKDEKKSGSKVDCSAICGKKDEKKSGSKIDCSAVCGKKDKKKSRSKIDCSAVCGKKDEKKSGSKIDCSAICGKKDNKKSASKTDCSAVCGKKDEKKSGSKIDCSAICGKKDDKKSGSKIDCSAISRKGDKKSGSKIDCSAICGKKDEKKSGSKIDCSAICGKKDDKKSGSKIDCSAICGKKDEKKSGSKIDCSAICGKKDEKKSGSKIDCSAICGKKDEKKSGFKIDCSAICGKKDGKKSESKIQCSAVCGKKDNKKSGSKIDCSAICGKKDDKKSGSKIDCSAVCGKKGEKKSASKIDCSAICGKKDSKKSGSKIDCSAVCGKKGEKKSASKIDCSAICGKKDGKKSESKIQCSAVCGKKDDKKSGSKIDCSAICGKKDEKKSGSKIDCSAICGKKDGKKSESKIQCSAVCGKKDDKKSGSKIDCSEVCGKKDEKKSGSKIDCSAICGKKDDKKSGSKIDCSAVCAKKDNKKSGSKIDCSAVCGKKDEKKSGSKIDCSAICGKKDEKKSGSKIDCSEVCGKKDEKKSGSKIDCSAVCGKKDDKRSGSKIDCSAICGKKDEKKSESKIQCSAVCGKKGDKKSGSKIDCSAICGKKDDKKSGSKIDCSAICGKKDDKKSGSKIDCSEMCGKKDENKSGSKVDCSAICGKKDEKKSGSKTDCSAIGGKKSNCPCGKKDCQCAVQTIKIVLAQGMQIEITTAQINQENLQGVQDLLISAFNPKLDGKKADKSSELKSIAFETQEGQNEVTIGPITILFEGDTPSVPFKDTKKLKGDKSDKNTNPFKVGDVKAYSTNSRKSPEIITRPTKKKFKITSPEIIRGRSITDLKHAGCVADIEADRMALQQETVIPETCPCPETEKVINKIVKVIDCREVCVDSIPVPQMGDYDVLLKVDSVGLSGSDLYMYETGAKTDSVVTLGHEASGVVEKVGKCVTNVSVGDRIVVEPGVPCGTCDRCKRGRYNICDETIFNGSLAKYCIHPSDFCHKLPDQCNLEVGSLVHPLALGLYACNRAKVSVKSNVLVIGACPLGLCCVLSAKAMGARYVTIVDVLEKNLEVATRLGADIPILLHGKMTNKDVIDCILNSMCRIGQPNVVINCSGCTKSLNTSVMCLAPGGVCVLAGCQTECGYFSILEALMKEISMVSSFRSCNTFPHAIALLESHRAELAHLITHRFFLSNVKQAFETALDEQDSQAIKVIVKCQEETQQETRR